MCNGSFHVIAQSKQRYIHVVLISGLSSLAQRLARVLNVWWWVVGLEHGIFRGMLDSSCAGIFLHCDHCDWIVMAFGYPERPGGNLRSLGWLFGRLGLLGTGWWGLRQYLKVLESVAIG